MIEKIEQVTVLANDFHVETSSTQASEVVTGAAITALHGHSFTGLMALEPGIVPMTIEQPESTVMARVSVALAPSGILDPRNQSISGRREDAQDRSISGITRASTGFAVTISSDGDDSLMGRVPNGVNNHLDLPGNAPAWLNLNSNPQNGRLYFNRSLFSADALGTPGTASRRSFRVSFNTFNHAQFLGPVTADGDIGSKLFGQVVEAAPPRPVQVALKFTF
jgi:hypothetical protein